MSVFFSPSVEPDRPGGERKGEQNWCDGVHAQGGQLHQQEPLRPGRRHRIVNVRVCPHSVQEQQVNNPHAGQLGRERQNTHDHQRLVCFLQHRRDDQLADVSYTRTHPLDVYRR